MFLNENAIKALKDKNYRESSIKTMDYNIKRIFKDAGFENKYIGIKLRDSSKIIDVIKTYPIKQQKQYIYTVMVLFEVSRFKKDSIYEQYSNFFDNVSEKRQNLLTTQQPSQSIDTNDVIGSMYQVYEKYQRLFSETPTKLIGIKLLITSLYVLLPPARPQVYLNAIYSSYEESFPLKNVINLDDTTFTIKQGKTMKPGNSVMILLPEQLINIIKNVSKLTKSTHLITELKSNKPMDQKQFTQLFKHITGFTPTLLRNVYISKYIDDNGLENTQTRQDLAKFMGNSVGTQNNIYSKYSSRVHSN